LEDPEKSWIFLREEEVMARRIYTKKRKKSKSVSLYFTG
jgi:hypothetical protein